MSRLIKKPVAVPKGVEVKVEGQKYTPKAKRVKTH